jgi:hypothetical protein
MRWTGRAATRASVSREARRSSTPKRTCSPTTSTPTTWRTPALLRGAPQRIYHVSDDSALKMGDYLDQVADAAGLQRPPRISRAEAERALTPMQMSFWSESRRLDNRRLKTELRMALRYPTPAHAMR